MMNEDYVHGFMSKCAELGVDPEKLVKTAQGYLDYYTPEQRARDIKRFKARGINLAPNLKPNGLLDYYTPEQRARDIKMVKALGINPTPNPTPNQKPNGYLDRMTPVNPQSAQQQAQWKRQNELTAAKWKQRGLRPGEHINQFNQRMGLKKAPGRI